MSDVTRDCNKSGGFVARSISQVYQENGEPGNGIWSPICMENQCTCLYDLHSAHAKRSTVRQVLRSRWNKTFDRTQIALYKVILQRSIYNCALYAYIHYSWPWKIIQPLLRRKHKVAEKRRTLSLLNVSINLRIARTLVYFRQKIKTNNCEFYIHMRNANYLYYIFIK